MEFEPEGWTPEAVQEIAARHALRRGPLLPSLIEVQERFGWISPATIGLVAYALNLSRAEVYGVVTFYNDLRTTPAGRTVVQLCRGEACQANGSTGVVAEACTALGIALGETTADGAITLDEVFCLGNCALGPSVRVGRRLHARVDRERVRTLLAAAR